MSSLSAIPGVTPTGAVPDYVPPHLQGKVWDFRNEPGGGVSFAHPEMAMGLAPDRSRVTLSPEQYKQTFDRTSRYLDFERSMENQYAPLERIGKTPARRMNEGIANALRRAYDWGTSSQGKAVSSIGLLSALGGTMGSYLWDRYQGQGMHTGRALLAALLAGTAGAGLTALGQTTHRNRERYLAKSASVLVSAALMQILDSDPTLGRYEKAQIIAAANRMSPGEQNELYRLARTTAGVGVGVLIMRFLGAKGLLPLAAGGIIGGLLGSRRPGPERNALGQISMTNYL